MPLQAEPCRREKRREDQSRTFAWALKHVRRSHSP